MNYYESKDLADFPNITEWAEDQGNKFLNITARPPGQAF